jgi:cytidylate kinase
MLDADISTRAQRIVNREAGDVKIRMEEMLRREQSEIQRYKIYYDIDLSDVSIYDIVIDTADKTPSEIADLILDRVEL